VNPLATRLLRILAYCLCVAITLLVFGCLGPGQHLKLGDLKFWYKDYGVSTSVEYSSDSFSGSNTDTNIIISTNRSPVPSTR
jgi:hypothetical protein